jgi:hypothetical protein
LALFRDFLLHLLRQCSRISGGMIPLPSQAVALRL